MLFERITGWIDARLRALEARSSPERAFLPAALEIIETPASPAGRMVAATIMGAAVLALAWSFIGHVDVVSTAPGRIVPVGQSKTVQPMDTGVIVAIKVAEGDHVRAGQDLIDLDPTQTTADRDRFTHDALQARLDLSRLQGLWTALKTKGLPALVDPPADASTTEIEAARASMISQAAEQRAKLASLDQQIVEKAAEAQETGDSIERLKASLPYVQGQVDIHAKLKAEGYGTTLALFQSQQQLVEQQHQIVVLASHRQQAEAERLSLMQQRSATAADYEKTLLDDLNKAKQQTGELGADLTKAQQKLTLQTLRAPISGTVQQLAVHTIGGVVTPAQALLVVVPDNARLSVEAMVNNRDVGFIHPGQPAKIKIETFNFTRYGLIDGVITSVSHDVVTQSKTDPNAKAPDGADDDSSSPQSQPQYVARVSMTRNWMATESGRVLLGPGMSATVEIHTGKRRIISYLLSPLARKVQESLHER